MEASHAVTALLNEVGPRLRRARDERNVTLRGLAAATGISKSTRSRLEPGRRKPSLELLLPIALAHQIPLDELVEMILSILGQQGERTHVRATPRRRDETA